MFSLRCLLAFIISHYLYLKVMSAEQSLAFDFMNFGKDSNFESQLSLHGDAKVANGSLSLQVAGSGANATAGRIFCKRPLRVFDSNSSKMVSFSSYFVFSLSGQNRNELGFLMIPLGYSWNDSDSCSAGSISDNKMKCVAFKFHLSKDDLNGNNNHVRVNVESPLSVKPTNESSINLKLHKGEKVQSWIDYEASSKRFEVRLSKFGSERPVDPSLNYPIDLSKTWEDSKIILGLISSAGERNSTHNISIYSWSFSSRTMPRWMRSHPIDPKQFTDYRGKEVEIAPKKSVCAVRIIAALVLGAGCGAVGAFLLLSVWILFGNRRPVVPEDIPVKEAEEFDAKKLHFKPIEDGSKN